MDKIEKLENEIIELRNEVKRLSLYRKGILDNYYKLGAKDELIKLDIAMENKQLEFLQKYIKRRIKILQGRDD